MERATRFMDEPLVRDQLPYLAEWTGLVARPYDFWTGSGDSIYSVDEILAGRGQQPWGRDLIFSLLSVLDIAIAQQSVLHGDVTTKFVYDFTWDKTAHAPIEPQQGTANTLQKDAIKLLQNKNNPWLGKNVLLMGLRDSLHSRDASGDLSIPYQKALSILNSAEDVGPEVNPSQLSDEQKKTQEERKKNVDAENLTKIQEANFALRGIFDVPDTVKFTFEDSDDGSGGRVRKDIFASGSYKLELPSPAEFARGQLSYPPSLISLLKLREVMTDRLVDYQLVRDISDPIEQKRVAGLLFSGLASSKQWANIGTQSSASAGVRVK